MDYEWRSIWYREADDTPRIKSYLPVLVPVFITAFILIVILLCREDKHSFLYESSTIRYILHILCATCNAVIRLITHDFINFLYYVGRVLVDLINRPFAFVGIHTGLTRSSHVKKLITSVSRGSEADCIGPFDNSPTCKLLRPNMTQFEEKEINTRPKKMAHRKKFWQIKIAYVV